jgi:Domain of unknown function (DUF4286)
MMDMIRYAGHDVTVLTPTPAPMILYEVTLEVEPASAAALEEHMRRAHIPAIFATGCFLRVEFDRASETRFRTVYEAATVDDLNRYLQDHSPRFRADFVAHFPAGVTISRETWTQVERWG